MMHPKPTFNHMNEPKKGHGGYQEPLDPKDVQNYHKHFMHDNYQEQVDPKDVMHKSGHFMKGNYHEKADPKDV